MRIKNIYNQLIHYYKNGTEGVKIIYISVISTLLYHVINFISTKIFSFPLISFFLLSADYAYPYLWTGATFLFIHRNFFELLFFMVFLFYTEKIFRVYFNAESFLKFFILGNVVGVLAFLAICFILQQTSWYLSGVVLGGYSVLFAVISYAPKLKVTLFPIPVSIPFYVLGIVLIGLDILSLYSQPIVYFIPKLLAAVFGYFYMKFFQKGNDFLGKFIPNFNKLKQQIVRNSNNNFKTKKNNTRKNPDEQFNLNKVQKQKQIDGILDKISDKGYDSLTKEEKRILFNSSK